MKSCKFLSFYWIKGVREKSLASLSLGEFLRTVSAVFNGVQFREVENLMFYDVLLKDCMVLESAVSIYALLSNVFDPRFST